MGGKNVYFNQESSEIIKKMNRGKLSEICRIAVKDWEKSSEDLDFLKNKLKVLSYNKEKIENEFNILKEKIEGLEINKLENSTENLKELFTEKVFALGINKVEQIENLYQKFKNEKISLSDFLKKLNGDKK